VTSPSVIDQALLDKVLSEAQASPRRRKNLNFHDAAEHPCQRLINAVLPDAYIQPHRHLDPRKEEMLVILRGRLGLVFFDDGGKVTGTLCIAAGGPRLAVNIPARRFHTAVAVEPAVVFEAKAGPYVPHLQAELAGFAPQEESPEAGPYLAKLKSLFRGA
jgi:cupin fold WbuC family metalloprotein